MHVPVLVLKYLWKYMYFVSVNDGVFKWVMFEEFNQNSDMSGVIVDMAWNLP